MNILLAYNVWSKAVDRFRYVQEWQQAIYPGVSQYDRVIFSDRPFAFPGFTSHLCVMETNGCCNVALARNYALEYAEKLGYSHIMLCDIDTVIYEGIPDIGPRYVSTHNCNTKEGETPTTFKPNGWKDGGFVCMSLERKGLRYDPRFYGHFWEDVDFLHNVVIPSGLATYNILNPPKTLHVWHGARPDNQPETIYRNMVIFCSNAVKLRKHLSWDAFCEWWKGVAGFHEAFPTLKALYWNAQI